MNIEYYYGRIKNDLIVLKDSYRWNNSESIFAMKTAVACILSMLVAYYLELQQGYWASISSLIISLPSAGAFAKKSIYRFLGTVTGAIAAVFISGLFAQNHILYSLAIFLFISISLYISMFSQYRYFWFLMAVTSAIIMISSISQNSPEKIVFIAFNRWFEVSIGIIVTSFLNLLVWPKYAVHDYHKKTEEVKKNYEELLNYIFLQYMDNEYDFESTKTKYYSLIAKIKKVREIVDHATFEIKTARRQKSIIILDTKQLELNLYHIWEFYLSIKKFNDLHFHKSFYTYIKEILNLGKEINGIKHNIKKKAELINLSNSYINQMQKRYLNIKIQRLNRNYEIKDVFIFQEFLLIIKEFVDFSKNKIYFNSNTLMSSENKIISYFPEEIYTLKILDMNIKLSIPMIQYAVKVGFSVIAVIWLWQYFEIPSGGTNMAIAVLLVLQPDIMATYLKGLLRFLGCLTGVLLGFAFLSLQIESTFLLCIALFIIIYFSMYIYFKGGTGISYAGLQLALAFLIAALPEPHATIDTILFIKRLIGIFFGVSVAWLINITVFSKDILTNYKEKLNFLKNKISDSSQQFIKHEQDLLIPDLASFYSSLNVITDQKEITIEDSFFINKYLKNIDKFFRERYLLISTDIEISDFLNEHNQQINLNVCELIKNFNIPNANLKKIEIKIHNTLDMIEDFRHKNRYNNLTYGKNLNFRQNFCQYVVNLKRILFTLSELYQIQEKINI